MSKRIDIAGKTYNFLTVIKHLGGYNWLCVCVCGNEKIVKSVEIRRDHVQSCGCKRNEIIAKKKTIHGQHGTKIYQVWINIRNRCYNKKNNRYETYGKRGITVCEEWNNSFSEFRDYVIKHIGDHPGKGYSIDRIDINKGYCPGNIKWATNLEQSLNKTNSKYLTYNGVTRNLTEWSILYGIKYSTLQSRLNRKWDLETVLTAPVMREFNRFKKHPSRLQT